MVSSTDTRKNVERKLVALLHNYLSIQLGNIWKLVSANGPEHEEVILAAKQNENDLRNFVSKMVVRTEKNGAVKQ